MLREKREMSEISSIRGKAVFPIFTVVASNVEGSGFSKLRAEAKKSSELMMILAPKLRSAVSGEIRGITKMVLVRSN